MKVIGADPYVLYDDKSGYYYCYATSGDHTGKFFHIYKSKDLVEWQDLGFALDTSVNCWGKDWYWAPECYYNPNNDKYYLFYSARVKDELTEEYFEDKDYFESAKIGVAVSDSPEGPFININDRPMDYYPFDKDYLDVEKIYDNIFEANIDPLEVEKAPRGQYVSMIDVNLFFDGDKIYMYYSRCCYKNVRYDKKLNKFIEESNIVAVELETDWWFDKDAKTMPTVKKEYINKNNSGSLHRRDGFVNIINYAAEPQDWENGHVSDYEISNGIKRNRRWSEGSTTFKVNFNGEEYYALTYSCNNYENALYGVGISFSKDPLTIFKKYEGNPVIKQIPSDSLYSTGHGCLVEYNNETYYFFHGRENLNEDRVLYVGKLHLEDIDNIYVDEIKQCKLV